MARSRARQAGPGSGDRSPCKPQAATTGPGVALQSSPIAGARDPRRLCASRERAVAVTKARFYVKGGSLFARLADRVRSVGGWRLARFGGRYQSRGAGRGRQNVLERSVDGGQASSRVARVDLQRATSAVSVHRGRQRAGERR